ncbi:MAG TPA: MFS transporter [Candidatus Avacidaminococcus intestinavium]|uniref:MFS transporter n=1 Tax=Candidatus Avacidaminococcus intestinavium TaxID=2840684 RepID=A0A9D1MNT8_9FIRM|nr:MFS transporter [Candidatus Avacidaminococcus intestinavium]
MPGHLLKRLDSLPVNKFHYRLLIITGLGWLFDAMDTGLIAFVLPVLGQEWNLSTGQMGMIGSSGLIGMAIGAIVSGTLAEKVGRKRVFELTLLLYSLATGLCALAWSYEALLVFRFFVGFGLGGELPVAVTLVSEYVPSKVRGRFIVLLESFWGIGWIVAACIAYLFIPIYGWHWAFIIGALPAFYVFVIRRGVPESVRYLLSKGKYSEAERIVSELENKIEGTLDETKLSRQSAEIINHTQSVSFSNLWSTKYLQRTIMLWVAWFGIVFSYYGVFTWLPTLVYKQGFSFLQTFEYVLIMTLAQLPGYFTAAWLVETWGRKYTLFWFLLGTALSGWLFGQALAVEEIILWGSLMSFFNLGAWGVLYTYTPELYPTFIRAYGSGWAAGFGRLGGVLAPLSVGIMLEKAYSVTEVFYLFALVLVLTAIVIMLLGPETKHKNLEEI